MVFTKKFSEFVEGTVGEPVGLTGGVNTRGLGNTESGGVIITVDQDTTGLAANRWVRFDDATQLYTPALATSPEFAEVVGVVLEVLSGTQFQLQQSGYISSGTPGFSGFSTEGVYFLSDNAIGQQTLTAPTTNGYVRLPLFIADSTDSGWVCSLKTGMVIGSPAPLAPGAVPDDSSIHVVNQGGNTFNVGDWVRVIGDSVYALADGTSFANSQGVGLVIDDGDPSFTVQFSGFNANSVINAVDSTGTPIALVSGTVYYLSDVTPGAITPTKPTDVSTSVKPCFICESETMFTGYVLPQQPIENTPGEEAPTVVLVNQGTHGFLAEDVVRVLASGTYVKALADSLANARAVGIVVEKIDDDNFVLQTAGFSDKFTAKTPATQYYLSATTPGLLTATEPTADGEVSKPMFQALTATSGFILEQRPMVQPNANGGGSGSGSIPSNVVQALHNTAIALTTGDLPFSVSITPSSSTSRVKLMFSIPTNSSGQVNLVLKRNGVILTSGGVNVGVGTPLGSARLTMAFNYVDSPATTSAVTYSFAATGVNSYGYGAAAGIITLIAEEVGPA